MERSEGPLPTPREMVDAFVHCPELIPIGHRAEGDFVVVLSHVELWPWRVVVRALVANPDFAPQPVRFSTEDLDLTDNGRVGTVRIGEMTVQHRERWKRDIDWVNSWTLADDTGTKFTSSGWRGNPHSDHQLWSDLELSYDAVVSPQVKRLVISGPVFGSVEVPLPR